MTEVPNNKQEWTKMIQQIFPKPASYLLDFELLAIDDKNIKVRLPITGEDVQPFGILRSGVSMLLAETTSTIHACWGVDLSKLVPMVIEINGTYLQTAADGYLLALGNILHHQFESLVIHQVEIYHAETDNRVFSARVTQHYVPPVAFRN